MGRHLPTKLRAPGSSECRPAEPLASFVRSSGSVLLIELACGFGGTILLVPAWLAIIESVVRATGVRPWRLARIFVLWTVPLLVAPPMFSRDIYAYAAQGEMVSHHISPYLYGPGVMGAMPFASPAGGVWVNTTTPYGPLFTGIDGDLVRVAGHHVLAPSFLCASSPSWASDSAQSQ